LQVGNLRLSQAASAAGKLTARSFHVHTETFDRIYALAGHRYSPPAALANLPDAPPQTLSGAALTAWLDELFRGIK